jgi:hypothetical protein
MTTVPDRAWGDAKSRELAELGRRLTGFAPLLVTLARRIEEFVLHRKEELVTEPAKHFHDGVDAVTALLKRCIDGTSPAITRDAFEEYKVLLALNGALERFLKRRDELTLRRLQDAITLFERAERVTEEDLKRFAS